MPDASTIEGIVVDLPSGRMATDSADGYCDILEAISAATFRVTVRECANPEGSARVVLAAGATYPTGKTLRLSGGPDQHVEFVVAGADAGGVESRAVITAAQPWLLDPGDPPTSCLVHVSGGATLQLFDVTLTQAPALALTGACLTRGTVAIRNSRVTGFRNSGMMATCFRADGCDYDAGDSAMLQVANSLIDGNSTPNDGGGAFSDGFGATQHIYHSSVVNNTAGRSGGGLYLGGGWNTNIIRASTISGNQAGTGGGVMVEFECSNTYVNIFSSTIADNTAQGTGGGIHFHPADVACSKQDVTVYSSVIAANHSLTTEEMNINSSWWTDDPLGNLGIFACPVSSLIYVAPGLPLPGAHDLPCQTNTRDPRLGPLTPMGGKGNLPVHPLLPGSPAIDVGGELYEEQRNSWIPDVDPPLPASEAWVLYDRPVDGDDDGKLATDLGAVEMGSRWQTELLSVAAKGPSPHRVIVTPPGLDRGAGTEYAASSANQFVTYRLPIVEAGYYDITVGALQTPGSGTFALAIADKDSGPWTQLGPAVDGYASAPGFTVLGPYRTPLFKAAGDRFIRITVTGTNAASSGYRVALDYVDARRSTTPCAAAAVVVGANHSCAVPAGGGVRCWGANDSGQLGESGVALRAVPSQKDVITGVKAVVAGVGHTCALTTAGGVRCWGANAAGQLGDGTTTNRFAPPSADVLTGVKAIAAGGFTTCALMQAGGVRCWGANTFGQLGDGTTADRATPPATDVIGQAASVSVGIGHVCVVTTAGGVRCWGHNGGGELGTGTLVELLAPPTTDLLTGVREVAAGSNFTCVLMDSTGVRCWGYNSDGQIGDETPNATERMTPPTADILGNVASISAGNAHVCARMKTGGIRCWGGNSLGQLGDGLTPDPAATPPPQDIVQFTGTCR